MRAALSRLLSQQNSSHGHAPSFSRIVLIFPTLYDAFKRMRDAFARAAVSAEKEQNKFKFARKNAQSARTLRFPLGVMPLSDAPAVLADLGFTLSCENVANLFLWIQPDKLKTVGGGGSTGRESAPDSLPRTVTIASAHSEAERVESLDNTHNTAGYTSERMIDAPTPGSSHSEMGLGIEYREFCLAMAVGAVLQLQDDMQRAEKAARGKTNPLNKPYSPEAKKLVTALQLALTTWTLFDVNGEGELQESDVFAIMKDVSPPLSVAPRGSANHLPGMQSQSNQSGLFSKERWSEMAADKGHISISDFLLSLQLWVSDVAFNDDDE